MLLVAVCGGRRCRALRALADNRWPETPTSDAVIRESVRGTRHAIMLSTGCLGPCAQAAVVALGRATINDRALAWLSPPSYWGSTETPQRAAALGQCINALTPLVEADTASGGEQQP